MEIIEHVENNSVFVTWKKEHPEAYLVHVFIMEKPEMLDKQIGYFDPQTENITTFSDTPVKITGEDKSFNKEDNHVTALDLTTVKVSFENAVEKSMRIVKEKYSAHVITQKICILQHLDTQLWNMTLISSSFALINVRIDATTGTIISEQCKSIMDLGTQS